MHRKLLALLLVICVLSTSLTTIVLANTNYDMVLLIGNPKALVGGASKQIDPDNDNIIPFVVEGRTLVPLRFVAESFGAVVGFEDATQTISIVMDDNVIYMQPDSLTYWVNDEEFEMDVAPMIFEGRTFVPFRKVAEIMGKYVSYDDGVIVLTKGEVSLASEDFVEAKDILLNGPTQSSEFSVMQSKIDPALSPVNLNASTDKVNPLAFYVGKVQREFKDSSSLQMAEINNYITDSEVKSINGDLTLNYSDQYLVINTEKAQGIVGFLKSAPKDFPDVKIDSSNDYASIVVTTIDNMPIKNSDRILIQSMTDEKVLGFETTTISEARNPSGTSASDKEIIEKKQITNLGGGLMQVREIEAVVTLKGITEGYLSVLDENGYVRDILEPVFKDGNMEVNVPKDAIYIVYSKTPTTIKEVDETGSSNYIWWEGEDFTETNFPDKTTSTLDPVTASGTDDFSILSGSDWISMEGNEFSEFPDRNPYLKYEVEVDEDGDFGFYIRKFWFHGPFKWRFNDDEWKECNWDNTALLDEASIRLYHGANWVFLDDISLPTGTHTFEMELLQDSRRADDGNSNYVAGVDCFILSREPFVPSGKIKPDENKPSAEQGFFAFDPKYDNYTADALLDLRGLNEEIAGQNGFISTDGENFIFPNGEKMRFWGVNTGMGTISSSNSTLNYMAKSLAKRGVNLIRVHGTVFSIENRKAVIDPVALDKLHYFIYAMKNEGIYTNLSIYFPLWFEFGTATGYPEYDDNATKNPFTLLQFENDFQAAYKDAVKEIFNSVNQYTGVALKDEPALAFFEMQNEDNYFFWTFKADNVPDVYFKQLEKMFGDWLTEKYGSIDSAASAWGGQSDARDDFSNGIVGLKDAWYMTREGSTTVRARMADQLEFLTINQKEFYADIDKYLKEDLGVKALTIAGNWTTAEPNNLEALDRYTYSASDVIDRHGYFEPEIHQGDGRQSHAVSEGDKYVDTTGLRIPDRIPLKFLQNAGLPYMDSEINWPNPNRFRAEFPMLLSAYASLQGADAPILFALGTSFDKTIGKFALYTPVGVGQFPAAALMYRNGYVQETEPVVLETLNLEDLYQFKGSFINESQNLDLFRQN